MCINYKRTHIHESTSTCSFPTPHTLSSGSHSRQWRKGDGGEEITNGIRASDIYIYMRQFFFNAPILACFSPPPPKIVGCVVSTLTFFVFDIFQKFQRIWKARIESCPNPLRFWKNIENQKS